MKAYVYIKTDKLLWTVGFYNPSGDWVSESDHGTPSLAAERVHYLNGGCSQADLRKLYDLISEKGE